ncbi:hypothetical protein PV755_44465 [Streptomyces caniscabiei]|uniref:hypothetical protein n=1 Tax=Streptomyces caniscabiei TaxID=2746961 RepID=UPI0029B53AD4|nr:hypothetical protein [Streptomyces caniscabiei]MDX3515876.1 hypothetical protein [Streptomyces caniscabiei]MDX3725056.1 hypothetical protein [Streptomyces caniscabiei]
MAIESGLGWTTLNVDDSGGSARDIRASTFNLDWTMPRGVQDITSLAESAMARLLLLADFSGTMAGGFDDGADLAHAVFKTVSSTSVERTMGITISGQTLNNEVILTDYAMTRAQSGEFTWSVPFQLASGLTPTWS